MDEEAEELAVIVCVEQYVPKRAGIFQIAEP
jgi:hypothetical protein